MRLTLLSPPASLAVHYYDFIAPGGTLGRSPDNQLVLPDPERAISRLQALIHVAPGGECRLTSQGSVTPVWHNGVALTRGDQVLLTHGDRLAIGPWQLAVSDPQRQRDEPVRDDPLLLFGEDAADDDPLGLLDEPVPAADRIPPTFSAEQLEERAARDAAARLAIDPLRPQRDDADAALPEQQRLLQALVDGLGLENASDAPPLTEQQMYTTGRMLSLFTQGTVALLSSRSILKRGVKAEMTQILNEANNPFKILPSGKMVMRQIYQNPLPGFMPPEQAVRDALVDLQAHQLGMIAGIRAIIAAMLQSFNPQRVEDDAVREGVLPRIGLSATRKAALWDAFTRHYQHTAGEIEDDFHTLFGEAFLHAYEMEVHQYKDSQTPVEEG
ncbi:type VI secretion system-associated FHA domain protein TagH [Erwinia sp. B116]|uniref:type VI secretion system-associated FHA domain protein TagH n=1 Tax=Erwinia sp. B116 TaxID=1561024 RepID=UPI000C76AD81|nr:type VI secretion system-associated FHA domain protein TagH [Erwinia sp. B116]PLV58582.1 type VI secretion system, core protein [Erwinia sp. B116]